MTAREEILSRIGAAHVAAPPSAPDYGEIDRRYRDVSRPPGDDVVELLVDRLLDYNALVRRAPADDVAAVVAAALRDRGVGSLAAPPGLPPDWLAGSDAQVMIDGAEATGRLTVPDLDRVDGVITSCAVAIAETGTLVLDGAADQGRRALTLVPDYHLCVVLPDRVAADVSAALARLDPSRPLTFISGPSATSDIELNRVEGVHGPRTLEVVLVGDPTA